MKQSVFGLVVALSLTACKEEPRGKMEPIPRPPGMKDAPPPAEVELATTPPGSVDVLAQDPEVSTGGRRAWIGDNIIFTILALIACVVLLGGLRGNLSKVFTVGGLSLVGIAFFSLASSESAATGIGNWILGLFGIRVV